MKLGDYFKLPKRGLSFELFPPKTDAGVEQLMNAVQDLARFQPDFLTCTYGAGGSTRDRTLQVATNVRKRFGLPVASHLTCVGSTRDQLRSYLDTARDSGVDYIVALRGDPPKGQAEFQAVEGGLRYANELVELIRAEFANFGIAVAGYPEVHQEAPNRQVDLDNLKRKVDAGADIVVTQLFYNNDDFFRFRDACVAIGIRVPVVPGILPITNLAQIQRISSMCKANLPLPLVDRLSRNDEEQWQYQVGVEYAADQVRQLLAAGAPGIHFYVLNKSGATSSILSQIGDFKGV